MSEEKSHLTHEKLIDQQLAGQALTILRMEREIVMLRAHIEDAHKRIADLEGNPAEVIPFQLGAN